MRNHDDDRAAVARFSESMCYKLFKNLDKNGWKHMSLFHLLKLLKEEVAELEYAIKNEPAAAIINEAADVANYAMMIADNMSLYCGAEDADKENYLMEISRDAEKEEEVFDEEDICAAVVEHDAQLIDEELKKIREAVDPKHYKDYIEEYEWFEAIIRIPSYRNNPEKVEGALEFMVRKYLDRNGQKDAKLQELLKSLWYLKALCAFVKNGGEPILVSEIDDILK